MQKQQAPLFLLLLDNSGSMFGEKMGALNLAVSNLISSSKSLSLTEEPQIAMITFGGEALLHTTFTPAGDIDFQNIEARGGSMLTEALVLAKTVITEKTALILISDGRPDDGGFERRLAELTLKSEVYAVGIGFDADYVMLERFTKEKKHILSAWDMETIAEYLIAERNVYRP